MQALYNDSKSVPDDMLLGNLLFYNLTNMTVSESDMLNAFSNCNLPNSYVRKISHADAFRRATSSIKNEKVEYIDDAKEVFEGRINVDEVINDKNSIKRIVGVRVLNDQKEEVSYTQLGSIVYDRASDSCSQYMYPDSNHVNKSPKLFTKMHTRYMSWATYHNHDTIKNIVNRIVEDMHPIALMPTGICKFIPKSSKDTLYNLKELLETLSQYSDSGTEKNTVEIFPLIDTQQLRDLVNKSYENEIQDSLYEYSMQLSEILKKKQTLSEKQALSYIDKYMQLKKKAEEYQNLLGTYTQNITDQLKTAINFVKDNSGNI